MRINVCQALTLPHACKYPTNVIHHHVNDGLLLALPFKHPYFHYWLIHECDLEEGREK